MSNGHNAEKYTSGVIFLDKITNKFFTFFKLVYFTVCLGLGLENGYWGVRKNGLTCTPAKIDVWCAGYAASVNICLNNGVHAIPIRSLRPMLWQLETP